MEAPQGFLFSAIACGIRKKDRLDLGLIFCEERATSAGVFTKNTVKAVPVLLGKKYIKESSTRAILVNSGVANACTGTEGFLRAEKILEELSQILGVKKKEILPASTGVIGEQLPVERIGPKLSELARQLSPDNYISFARAIMTTDTFPKVTFRKTEDGIVILGIAKGAGMIAPNMATMLAFILTDGRVGKVDLQKLLVRAVDESFNRITVDGDMSTNDTVYALASNRKDINDWKEFESHFVEICKELALMIVRDGEGASKVIKIIVKGARTKKEAELLARAVADSPLVKTAFYGADPNWGRIFSALGKTQIPFDPEEVDIYLNNIPWVQTLRPVTEEEILRKEMNKEMIELVINLKRGRQKSWVMTCDLTEEYIKINASYRS